MVLMTKSHPIMNYTRIVRTVAVALIACVACSKGEMDTDTVNGINEKGIFGTFAPFTINDAPDTRAYVTTGWGYRFEEGDMVNIWSETGSFMAYHVTRVIDGGKSAEFSNDGGFDLGEGKKYFASHPLINSLKDKYTALPTTFEGQVQSEDDPAQLENLADYMYTYASGTCTNGNLSFKFKRLVSFIQVIVNLPKALTLTELTLTADKRVFALNGTVDITEGTFSPVGELSYTLTLKLDNVEVTDKVLNAYLISAPIDQAAKYVISVKDTDGKVYSSSEISKGTAGANSLTIFSDVTVESEEREYVKVTSFDSNSDAAGKYILVYPNETTYRAFSFTKAMENAEKAGKLAKDTHGLENILAMGSQLYATVVANNCIDINVEGGAAIAESLILTPDQEKEAAFDWDLVDGKVTLSATTQKGNTYSIGVDHAVVNVNGNADVVVAFNAPDVINAMKAIRGTDLPVDFDYLINIAVAQAMKEGIEFTPAQIARLKSGFEHLCVLAKSMVSSHPEVFGGGTLMDINLSTNVFDVVGRYYDNATVLSWNIAPQKRFGLATLGYHAYDKGFTFNVGLPQAGWFNRLEESLKYDDAEDFVAYWAQFDSQYNLGIPNFFERASRRALSELDSTTLAMLRQMAADGKFAAIGNVYKNYADRFNDDLEPVYIYKKVE